MGMKRVLLAEATAAQMREFARDVLGLQDVKDAASKASLTAQIQAAWDKDFITVSDAVDTTMAERRASRQERFAEETLEDHPEYVTVFIQVMNEPGGDRPVELGVNGVNILVPRGKDVEIKWEYFEALKNAEQHFFDPLVDEKGLDRGIKQEPRKVLRYPFQRVA